MTSTSKKWNQHSSRAGTNLRGGNVDGWVMRNTWRGPAAAAIDGSATAAIEGPIAAANGPAAACEF
jgi:hypothetical protein